MNSFDSSPLAPGDRMGPYRIVRKIGDGGMGLVYEARHDTGGGTVALKVLSDWLITEIGRQRFEREIAACSELTHPNTVAILDYGETANGTLYYAMEYLEGFDLGQLVQLDGAQSPARVLSILDQIAAALGDAHEHGLIHRDIKPANIVLCELGRRSDVAKLLDFGLVVPVKAVGRLTIDGPVFGTPRYVAPEMLVPGGVVTPATDFYSLGLVGYFLLSGRHAFDSGDSIEILRQQRDDTAVPIVGIPHDVGELLAWCLRKDPLERPQNAEALRRAIARCGAARQWTESLAREWWARHRAVSGAAST